jgi:predicted phage terminase large subunit-like protein
MIFPPREYVLVSVDTAYQTKEANDWSACTVWGVFRDGSQNARVILLEAWRERLELHGLVQRILDTARRRSADGVLIEAQASGLSVAQEMRRLMKAGEFTVYAEAPKGDKVARMHAVVPLFTGDCVFAPDRGWADLVIDEMATFPNAKHDDMADSATQALSWLRKRGLASLADEQKVERDDAIRFRGNSDRAGVPYDV